MSTPHEDRLAELKAKGSLSVAEQSELEGIEKYLATLGASTPAEPEVSEEPEVVKPEVSTVKVSKAKKAKK